jgi:hypothetical protein
MVSHPPPEVVIRSQSQSVTWPEISDLTVWPSQEAIWQDVILLVQTGSDAFPLYSVLYCGDTDLWTSEQKEAGSLMVSALANNQKVARSNPRADKIQICRSGN